MLSIFSLAIPYAVLTINKPISNPIIGSKIGNPMFDTTTPIRIAIDENMSVFWCLPSAISAGLLISLPICIMY